MFTGHRIKVALLIALSGSREGVMITTGIIGDGIIAIPRPIKNLSDQQLMLIAEGVNAAMHDTLKHADGGHEVIYGSARGEHSPFEVYGREGLACTHCGAPLQNLKISGRATVYCPQCQPQS